MIAAAFLSSAIGSDKSLEVGKKAPKIETVKGTNVGYDANSEEKTRIISFWSPKKPASRIANRNLSLQYGSESDNVEFISICTDKDENLMREVMKKDGISHVNAYSASQLPSRVLKDYDAEETPKAYMIGPDGKISKVL